MSQSVNTGFSKKTFTAFTDCILIHTRSFFNKWFPSSQPIGPIRHHNYSGMTHQFLGRWALPLTLTLTAFTPAAVLAGIAATFEGQGFAALRAKDAFSRDFLFSSRADRSFFHRWGMTAGDGFRLLQFLLYFIEHVEEGIADGHGAARAAAGITARHPADRIGRAVPRRIELVDDGIDIDAGTGADRNHT